MRDYRAVKAPGRKYCSVCSRGLHRRVALRCDALSHREYRDHRSLVTTWICRTCVDRILVAAGRLRGDS